MLVLSRPSPVTMILSVIKSNLYFVLSFYHTPIFTAKNIRECGSTLYVGLKGTFRMIIQKSTGPFLRFTFFSLKLETV